MKGGEYVGEKTGRTGSSTQCMPHAPRVPSRSDDHQATVDAVDHLAGLGHHEITYTDRGTTVMSSTRHEAYVEAMKTA